MYFNILICKNEHLAKVIINLDEILRWFVLALSYIVDKIEAQMHKHAMSLQDNVLFLNLVGRLHSICRIA